MLYTLDDMIWDAMLMAEWRCRKLRMGEVDFSPELDMLGKQWALWWLVKCFHDGKQIERSRIKCKAKAAGITALLRLRPEEATTALHAAGAAYKAKKPEASWLRDDFLAGKLTDDDTDEVTRRAIKRIIETERSRQAWHLICKAGGKSRMECHHN